jgi:hypothetical protein
MDVKNFKHLLNFTPKCIELNSGSNPKLILFLGLDLGVTQDPDPIYSFFLAECLVANKSKAYLRSDPMGVATP